MKKRYFIEFGILLLAATFLSTSQAFAQNVDVDISAAGYEVGRQDEKDLGLSFQQSQKLETLSHEFLAAQGALRDQIRNERDTLRMELSQENPDRSRLQSLAKGILATQAKVVDNHLDHIFKVQDVLTPEQRKKLHSFRAEYQAKLKAQAEESAQRGPEKKKGNKSLQLFAPPTDTLKNP